MAAAIAALAIAAPQAAAADTPPPPDHSITVTGTGEVSAPNDTSQLTFRVETKSRKPAAALSKTSARAQRVIDAVKHAGVAAGDVQSEDISVNRYVSRRKHHKPKTGYRAVNSVIVTVRDVNRTPSVITAGINAGANGLSGIDFSTSKLSDLYDHALSKGYDDAKRKAQNLAKQAGVTLGGPLRIEENFDAESVGAEDKSQFAVPTAAPAPPVQPGTATVDAIVTVTFAIS